MLKAGVTIGCAAAMATAAIVTVRLRHTRWAPSPLAGSEPFGERLAITVSRAGGMLTGAYVAGLLTIGAGGRLMMRLLAATSPEDVQGLRTEADEVIGEVSVAGTFFLIVVIGIGAAVLGLALYSMSRRWLPDRSAVAGLVGVAIGAGLLVRPAGLLSSTNDDFTLIAPVALAVALCLITLVLFGTSFGVLVDHLATRWPRPGWSPRGVVSIVPLAVLLPVPPLIVAAVIGVLAASVAPTLRARAARAPLQQVGAEGTRARPARIALVALGLLGGISVAVAAGQVLSL